MPFGFFYRSCLKTRPSYLRISNTWRMLKDNGNQEQTGESLIEILNDLNQVDFIILRLQMGIDHRRFRIAMSQPLLNFVQADTG
jgi:hypothetical protein